MPEAWIVATARSPIGRANKGSLVDVRPDDLAAHVVRAALAKVPALEPGSVEDLVLGCAQPAGEAGYNLARVVTLLAGMGGVPGTTVNRYCASSLQAVRIAAHAIAAGEGDAFVAAGVECVSRFGKGKADGMPDTKNARFGSEGLPNVYMAMGETAENVADRARRAASSSAGRPSRPAGARAPALRRSRSPGRGPRPTPWPRRGPRSRTLR